MGGLRPPEEKRLEDGDSVSPVLGRPVQHDEVVLVLDEDEEKAGQGLWSRVDLVDELGDDAEAPARGSHRVFQVVFVAVLNNLRTVTAITVTTKLKFYF
jgi:hypothetical protein